MAIRLTSSFRLSFWYGGRATITGHGNTGTQSLFPYRRSDVLTAIPLLGLAAFYRRILKRPPFPISYLTLLSVEPTVARTFPLFPKQIVVKEITLNVPYHARVLRSYQSSHTLT